MRRAAWAQQARQDYEMFSTVAAILTATDQHLVEVCEELSLADITDVLDQCTAAISRYGCLLLLLTAARARVTPLAEMSADGRLEAARQVRLARLAERSREFIASLRRRACKAA